MIGEMISNCFTKKPSGNDIVREEVSSLSVTPGNVPIPVYSARSYALRRFFGLYGIPAPGLSATVTVHPSPVMSVQTAFSTAG